MRPTYLHTCIPVYLYVHLRTITYSLHFKHCDLRMIYAIIAIVRRFKTILAF
jgi:hypothetical protein